MRTPLYYGQFIWSQKCQKSYIHYLYNTDTSVKRTLGSVPLVSVLKKSDCTACSLSYSVLRQGILTSCALTLWCLDDFSDAVTYTL